MRWLWRLALTLGIVASVTGAIVLFIPLRVTVDAVTAQSKEPLPEAFHVALRYSLSDDGRPSRIRWKTARLIAVAGPQDGIMRLVEPLFLVARLATFTDITQSERFVSQSFRPRCWTKGNDNLTVPESLYLAARMAAPSRADETFIRDGMARIAERAHAADEELAASFLAAAAGPLPVCE